MTLLIKTTNPRQKTKNILSLLFHFSFFIVTNVLGARRNTWIDMMIWNTTDTLDSFALNQQSDPSSIGQKDQIVNVWEMLTTLCSSWNAGCWVTLNRNRLHYWRSWKILLSNDPLLPQYVCTNRSCNIVRRMLWVSNIWAILSSKRMRSSSRLLFLSKIWDNLGFPRERS